MKLLSRNQLFVDKQVQGSLIIRILGYWFASAITMAMIILMWRILYSPDESIMTQFESMWDEYRLPFLASVLMLPLIVYDITRMSNRFVGPLFRLRKELHALSHGQEPTMLQFRSDDFWKQAAEDFNLLYNRVKNLERQLAESRGQPVPKKAEGSATNMCYLGE
jgi:hypothetical protein